MKQAETPEYDYDYKNRDYAPAHTGPVSPDCYCGHCILTDWKNSDRKCTECGQGLANTIKVDKCPDHWDWDKDTEELVEIKDQNVAPHPEYWLRGYYGETLTQEDFDRFYE